MNPPRTRKTLDIRSNFLAIGKKISSYATSRIVVLPAPYEATVSYGGGTRFGPQGILNASHYVEFYDEELDRELCNETGVATVPPVAFGKKRDKKALDILQEAVAELLQDGKFVITLGGEHTISCASIAAHLRKYPNLSVLHFDAHSDLRESYEGNPYSHASVMARVCEILNPRCLVQVGIRALCVEEARFIKARRVNTFYAYAIRNGSIPDWQEQVISALTDQVYVSFDVDAFDPSIMPSTGTPEPNGMLWSETMTLLKRVGERKKIVGCDVVELAPVKGLSFPDLTAARLVYKLMNYAFAGEKPNRAR